MPNTRYSGGWIQVHDTRGYGYKLHPLNPSIGEINIYSAARALSYMCRYGGNVLSTKRHWYQHLRPGDPHENTHGNRIYSVAQHSLIVSYCVWPSYALEALMHDLTEGCGLPDLPHPVKVQMPEYRRTENSLWADICTEYGLSIDLPSQVKAWDRRICATEFRDLMGPAPADTRRDVDEWPALPLRIVPMQPLDAYRAWVARFHDLTWGQRKNLAVHRAHVTPQPSLARQRYNRARYACGLRYMTTGVELAGLPAFRAQQTEVAATCG